MGVKAKPIARVRQIKGKDTLEINEVEKILPCKDEKALDFLLDFYARPFPSMYLPEDSPLCRRHHAEKVRPALRWWCRHYGRPVPDWLQGNGIYDDLPKEEQARLYGENPLDVIEYEEAEESKAPKAPAGKKPALMVSKKSFGG